MSEASLLSLFWEGFELDSHHSLGPGQRLLRLRAQAHVAPCCSGCGQRTLAVHDVSTRRVRERDLFDVRIWLELPVRRVRCVDCGVCTEAIPWLGGRRQLTAAMIRHIEALVRVWPVRQVAELLGVHWHTVKAIDQARLRRDLPAPQRNQLRRLMIDEFALHRGHRYATVVACAETQQVLWLAEGRSRESLRPFFEWLGPEHCKHIEAVAMDMNTAFDLEVQAHCPQAEVVYDLFHVVAKFGREVIDRVRVDQANALRADKPARRAIKRGRWLLLRNRQNLTADQAVKLEELLAANAPLSTVYLLKAQLKDLWYAPDEAEARRRWQHWLALVNDSGLQPLITFVRRLTPYLAGILASARHRLNTSVLEGMNNRIKVIKRTAYGYRDSEYFFLKIRDAFPGKVR